MRFNGNPWGSTISFDPNTSLELEGNLALNAALWQDVDSMDGETFKLFDWTGVSLSGAFNIVGDPGWDTSQLYTTGEVTFDGLADQPSLGALRMTVGTVPEPSAFVLLAMGALTLLAYVWRRRGRAV